MDVRCGLRTARPTGVQGTAVLYEVRGGATYDMTNMKISGGDNYFAYHLQQRSCSRSRRGVYLRHLNGI